MGISSIYSTTAGAAVLESTDFSGGRIVLSGNTKTIHYHHKDHLGSVRAITDGSGSTIEQNAYYPFGGRHTFGQTYAQIASNRYKFNGKELQTIGNLDLLDYGARMYDTKTARWLAQDPLAEKYYPFSAYNYCVNNPLKYIDLDGRDTVFVFDQNTRPKDNYKGETYTATIIVYQNGKISGIYRGSSYPNSISAKDNRTNHNTIKEGEYYYNNKYGHKSGSKKGLNIVNEQGERKAPGTNPEGETIEMTFVNVHSGVSDNKGPTSRGSRGCVTIHPDDAEDFFSNFEWNKNNPNTGTSTGKLIILRNSNNDEN